MRASTGALIADGDLFAFFLTRVESAAARRHAPVSANGVYYLAQLLAEQGRTEDGDDATLVELRQRAVDAPPAQQITLWKQVGDTSLIRTGYFRETLQRRHITRAYCQAMGESAYAVLSRILAGPRGGFGEVFGELADRWPACADVLAEVRDEAAERNDRDLLRLYEEYLATGSPRVAERLRELGVLPMRTRGSA